MLPSGARNKSDFIELGVDGRVLRLLNHRFRCCLSRDIDNVLRDNV